MGTEKWYNKDIDFTKVNTETWTKDEIPYPNKDVVSYTKIFKRFRRIPVSIWYHNGIKCYVFTVRAGANSDYSYTGGFEVEPLTDEEAQNMCDEMFKNNKLIH